MNPEENEWNKAKKYVSQESVFGTVAPVDENLDSEEVQLSIYTGVIRENDKRRTKQEEEWRLRMTCTQEWFIRCSWINKVLFIEALCNSTIGCFVLENILKSIQNIFTKDVVESLLSDSVEYAYDRMLKDDNRALDTFELNLTMKRDFFWFIHLDPQSQVNVILKLLRLGGGGLIFTVYKSAEKLYNERHKRNMFLTSVPEMEKEGSKQKLVKVPASKLSLAKTEGSDLESINEFTQNKLSQLARRESELLKYRKSRGIFVDDSKTLKKGETKEPVDYLQILPIWLNRRIMSYIDDKGLSGFKKVGKYWGKMIDESINEKSGRKAINAKINKIIGIKAKEEKKDEAKEEPRDGEQEEELEFIMELNAKELINKIKEAQKSVVDYGETYERVFSKKCTKTDLDGSECQDRCCDFDSIVGILAGSNKTNMIHFYSVRTGARLHFSVFGLESPVTCLRLHQDRLNIIIGFRDGKLISKDMKTNKTTATFNGHTMAVTSLFTTPSNLLSASRDNTIKYFQLWSGVCLVCIDLSSEFSVSSLLLRTDKPFQAAIGTQEGFVMVVDVDAKKFLKRVKLHSDGITEMAHEGDIFVTGSESGKIRIWSLNNLENTFPVLKPYLNIEIESGITCMTLYKNQIFSGCKNGTLKIISLLTGNIIKTMRISSQQPISGLKITEDKVFMKLIIWHEGGIEIRTFPLRNSSLMKKSTGKDNRESKQEAPKETEKNKTSEMNLAGYVRNTRGLLEVTPNAVKRTTYQGVKMPLKERCCTLFTLRTPDKNSQKFTSDVFSKVMNENLASWDMDFSLTTFPRLKPGEATRKKFKTN